MFIPVKPEITMGIKTHYISSKHITDIQRIENGEYEIIVENGNIYVADNSFDMDKFIRISNYQDRCDG